MSLPLPAPSVDELSLEATAMEAGWGAGLRGFRPEDPLDLLSGRASSRARTVVRRCWRTCSPRLRARLTLAYKDAYVEGTLQAAWRQAWEQGDLAYAASVREYFLRGDW